MSRFFRPFLFLCLIGSVVHTLSLLNPLYAEDVIDRIAMRDERVDQVLELLERLTGRAILRPPALPTPTITFDSQGPMSRDEFIEMLETLLSMNGIGVTPMGDSYLKVLPLNRMRTEAPQFITENARDLRPSGRVVAKIYRMNFLRPEEFIEKINPKLTPNLGAVTVFEKANSMMIIETVSNLQMIEFLLEEFDRPGDAFVETRFFEVKNARSADIIARLNALRQEPLQRLLSSNTLLDNDERTNQIIVVTDPRNMDYFADLISQMDRRTEPTTRNEVIFLKHAEASEVASLLTQLVSGQTAERNVASTRTNGTRRRTGEQPPTTPETTNGSETGNGAPIETTTPPEIVEQARDMVEELSSEFSNLLTILADERSNALIVSGTRNDIEIIELLIDKIDVLLAQVRIEVVIAEVTLSDRDARGIDTIALEFDRLDKLFNLGVSGPAFGVDINRDGARTEPLSNIPEDERVTTLFQRPFALEAVLEAARNNSNVNVLSVPTIVTTHNREADVRVGEQRPVVTGVTTDGTVTTTTRSQITFRDIGIELRVLPRIAPDGVVEMEITQIVDSVIGNITIDGNPNPIIGNREANSFVSVRSGETVVLGGLQSYEESDSKTRLALLGRIPVLGGLFGGRTKEMTRTELLLFIRPHVIRNTDEGNRDAMQMIERMKQRDQIQNFLESGLPVVPVAAEEDDLPLPPAPRPRR